MMRFKEVALSNASPEAKIAGLAVLLDKELLRLSEVVLNTKKLQGPQGEQGLQGPKGEQGDRGFDGTNGKDGSDGKDGKDGHEGKDGVGVQDAKIDFDGSLVITLTNGREINAGDVVPEGVADKIKVIKSGGGNSQTVLDAIEEIQATIATYGTMATQNADAVAITGGSINGTTIGAAVPATGVFTTLTATALTATGQTDLGGTSSTKAVRIETQTSSGQYTLFSRFDAGNVQKITAAGTSNLAIQSTGGGTIRFNTGDGSPEQMRVSHTSSAVNYVQVTGAATGSAPTISAQGSDTNSTLAIASKGTGAIRFDTGGATAQFRVLNTASAVNRIDVTGSATGFGVVTTVSGTDTNISQVFQSKGTGAIDLAAGSRGVNISNGGTVTAITRTAAGSGYTSVPTVAITAPTTAGGVQATATVSMGVSTFAVASGGTGYTLNDVLTVVGGTGTVVVVTASAVSAGVVTAVTYSSGGSYTVTPTNPAATTGGTGTGCTLNITYTINNSFTITNAGSGYVEQPTVSFSGGGGSGAAAYATVGSTPKIQTLGSNLSFYTPGGEQFRIAETTSGLTAVNFIQTSGNSAGAAPRFLGVGADANVGIVFSSKGTGDLSFRTNGTNQTQLLVAHTASAVNYVQVTGAATGNPPTISSQGSDSTIAMLFVAKGGQDHRFFSNTGSAEQFRVLHTAGTMANHGYATGAAAGSSPVFGVRGSDTNIDLTLTPKGTGNVRFGTLTASADAAITGYITIKDSGGTVRKLAVIA